MQSCSLPNSIRINIFINCADFSIMHHEPHRHIRCQQLHHQQNRLRQQCEFILLYHERHHYIFGKNNNSISTTIINCADFSIIHHELLHHIRCQHLQHQRNHLHQQGRLLLMYHKFHHYTAGKNNNSKNIFTTVQTSLSYVMNLTATYPVKTTTAKPSLSTVQPSPSYVMNLTSKTIFIDSATFSVLRHKLDQQNHLYQQCKHLCPTS